MGGVCLLWLWTLAVVHVSGQEIPTTDCPEYVPENATLTCTCKAPEGHEDDSATYSWPYHTKAKTLTLQHVQRDQNGSEFTCQREDGVSGVKTSVVYMLKVAYGPLSANIIIQPTTLVSNGSQTLTLTCEVKDVYPPPTFTWAYLQCRDNAGSTCSFSPRDPAAMQGARAACGVRRVYIPQFEDLVASKTVLLSVKYPPSDPPVIVTSAEEGRLLRTGDNVTCSVSGGSPPVDSVTLRCANPPLYDGGDVTSGAGDDVTVTSAVQVQTRLAGEGDMRCTCQGHWGTRPAFYTTVTAANFTTQHRAVVTSLTANGTSRSATVNGEGGANVHFRCSTFGRPAPSRVVIARVDNSSLSKLHNSSAGFNVTSVTSGWRLVGDVGVVVTCTDMGVYACAASNGVDTPDWLTLLLNVRCAPRIMSNVVLNLTELGLTIDLQSYPPPHSFTFIHLGDNVTTNTRSPASTHSGPAPNTSDPAPNTSGPAPNSSVSAPNSSDPATSTIGPASSNSGRASSTSGPAFSTNGPASSTSGPAPTESAETRNRFYITCMQTAKVSPMAQCRLKPRHVTRADLGYYRLSLGNGLGSADVIFYVNTPVSPASQKVSAAVIGLGTAGAVVAISLVVVVVLLVVRWRRRRGLSGDTTHDADGLKLGERGSTPDGAHPHDNHHHHHDSDCFPPPPDEDTTTANAIYDNDDIQRLPFSGSSSSDPSSGRVVSASNARSNGYTEVKDAVTSAAKVTTSAPTKVKSDCGLFGYTEVEVVSAPTADASPDSSSSSDVYVNTALSDSAYASTDSVVAVPPEAGGEVAPYTYATVSLPRKADSRGADLSGYTLVDDEAMAPQEMTSAASLSPLPSLYAVSPCPALAKAGNSPARQRCNGSETGATASGPSSEHTGMRDASTTDGEYTTLCQGRAPTTPDPTYNHINTADV